MRASFFTIAMTLVGLAAASTGCSNASDSESGSGSSDVTVGQSKDDRYEWTCSLAEGQILEVYPDFSEIHHVDPNKHTWSMQDGLTIETSPWVIKIADDEGAPIGTIDKHGQYAGPDGIPLGTCQQSLVKTLEPTSKTFAVDETLEYACDVKGGSLVVRPKFGEIDEINAEKGTFDSHDGMSFTLKSVETSPLTNELVGVDEEGTEVAKIVETDRGVTVTMGDLEGSCEKLQRTK